MLNSDLVLINLIVRKQILFNNSLMNIFMESD